MPQIKGFDCRAAQYGWLGFFITPRTHKVRAPGAPSVIYHTANREHERFPQYKKLGAGPRAL